MIKTITILAVLAISSMATAQQKDEATQQKIRTVAEKACDCTREISTQQPRDSIVKQINSCITGQILVEQMKGLLGDTGKKAESAVQSKSDTIAGGGKNITIYMDENFDEIQSYMFANCPAVKVLMNSNNQLSSFSMSKNKKALKFYDDGQEEFAREQYSVAVVSFNKAVQADPKFAFAWDNMGLCYRKLNNFKQAIVCYQKSLEVDPYGTMPIQNMAVAYEYLKDYTKAAETYQKMTTLHPQNPEGYYGAGRAYYLAGQHFEGVDNMMKAYLMYRDGKSPFVNDALEMLRSYYADMKNNGKTDVFMEAARKNDIKLN